MQSKYKRLGDYIQEVNVRNNDLKDIDLLGVSIKKILMPSIANTIGTNMTTYKNIKKRQFAYGSVTSRNGDKISVALLEDHEEALVSQSYTVFEIADTEKLLPEYLMMWFSRSEFDRYARYMSHGSAREIFDWEAMCNVKLPVPTIDKQRKIVKEYQVLVDRINLNIRLIEKLEETAKAIYRQWFVDFEFPDEVGKPYITNGGEMVFNEELDYEIPKGWIVGTIEECIEFINGYGFESDDLLDCVVENCYSVFKMGNIKKGGGLNLSGTKSWIEKDKCDKLKKFVLKKGDLLMAMTDMKDNIGLLGNTALLNVDDVFILNQRVGLLRAKNDFGISFRHLYIVTNSKCFLQDLRSRANRGVQVNLTTTAIISTKIIIANTKINRLFDHYIKAIFNKILTIENDLKYSERLSLLLLSKLTTLEEYQ